MTDRAKAEALANGVFDWMADRCITTSDALEDGAKRGVIAWLDDHRDDVIAAIAQAVAERMASQAPAN